MNLNKQVIEERDELFSSEDELPKTAAITEKQQEVLNNTKIYNRLEDNFHLSNKKALFWNM
jgi:hypothetical protein